MTSCRRSLSSGTQSVSACGETVGPRIDCVLRSEICSSDWEHWWGTNLVVHDEVSLVELRSRPDIAVDAPSGRVGYVELKAPGKRTPESWRPSRHDEEQWLSPDPEI
jgi:hypothetical protein